MIDLATGTFKIRVTGRPSRPPSSGAASSRRSVASGFLNFIYFTDFETLDPQAYSTSRPRATAQANCGDKYRSARAGNGCTEIQFVTGDELNGPLHTNDDSLLLCGSPVFGRDRAASTPSRCPARAPGYVKNGCELQRDPDDQHADGQVHRQREAWTCRRATSSSPTSPRTAASSYSGKTIVRLNGPAADGRDQLRDRLARHADQRRVADQRRALRQATTAPARASTRPRPSTPSPATCGNVYVSGTYSTAR